MTELKEVKEVHSDTVYVNVPEATTAKPIEYFRPIANPGPLGLMGFGMTTIILQLHNAGFFNIGPMLLGMGIFYGGLMQIVAGLMAFMRNDTFGATAFLSYGAFWESWVAMVILPKMYPATIPAAQAAFVGWYLFLWGLFTFFMFIGTLSPGHNLNVKFVFFSLWILFWLLAVAHFIEDEDQKDTSTKIAAWWGFLCGGSAFYLSCAEVLEAAWKKPILPIGAPKRS
eukprot:TRINITY_DN250_c0_g1_i2.p1 TRINITY_DN250_c0_g1~~TRINITY_DN250_c0_g1_i2.p1  ORF type:complete len:227 (-),score=71.65 TRINITY_DN250_c0_g1_i2:143-823(-)